MMRLLLLFLLCGTASGAVFNVPGTGGGSTTLPSYALTNNQTTIVTLGQDLVVAGTFRVHQQEWLASNAFPNTGGNVSNFWASFDRDIYEIDVTNNVHFAWPTNEPSVKLAIATYYLSTFGEGVNRTLSFNTNQFSLASTNYATLLSNRLAVVSFFNRRGTNRLAAYNLQVLP